MPTSLAQTLLGHAKEGIMRAFGRWLRGEHSDGDSGHDDAPAREEPVGGGESKSLAEDHTDFALALYAQLQQGPGNLFFSPFSVRTALGMAYAGAKGETAVQMRDALRLASSDQGLHKTLGAIIDRLNTSGGANYELSVANSLWSQEGAALQAPFLDLITQCYGGALNAVDFAGGCEAARVAINGWVEEKTRGRIQEIIAPDALGPDMRLVLVNAVYFKGLWVLQFPRALTCDEPFFLEQGDKVQVPLMHMQERLRYQRADGYQAVDLEYRGGDVSMLVILPDKKDGLRDLEGRLSAQMLHDCVTNARLREVELYLPRFRMSWGAAELGSCLSRLGMPLAFAPFQADFSGINGYAPPHERSLFISAVWHKAFLEVGEEGPEAAAATAVVVAEAAAAPDIEPPRVPVFRADHPFLLAIRDRRSNAVLFLGRIGDPTREN
jgi:serpin B